MAAPISVNPWRNRPANVSRNRCLQLGSVISQARNGFAGAIVGVKLQRQLLMWLWSRNAYILDGIFADIGQIIDGG